MAHSVFNNVCVGEGDKENRSKVRWFSFKEDWSNFLSFNFRPFIKDIQGQNILPALNALKKGLTFNRDNQENGSSIKGFLISSTNMNNRTEWIWKVLWKKLFLIEVVVHPQLITFIIF